MAKTPVLPLNVWTLVRTIGEFSEFTNMTDAEKRLHVFVDGSGLPSTNHVKVHIKDDKVIITFMQSAWAFMRNKFFVKRTFKTLATITPKRVFWTDRALCTECLTAAFGKRYFTPFTTTELRTFVFKGPECVVQKPYDAEAWLYEALKWVSEDYHVLIERLKRDSSLRTIVHDMIHQCKALNRKIKGSWSDRKISDMHNAWTREITALKSRNCSDEPIWKNVPELPGHIELLNSEKRVAQEGNQMHHCIWTNYGTSIKSKNYIAFHVTDHEGDFTVGIRMADVPYVDQAYQAWNKQCTDRQKAIGKILARVARRMRDRVVLEFSWDDIELPW